ncbi:MAG: hypothetical protein WCB04_02290 [Mycobacteriales bacterium]
MTTSAQRTGTGLTLTDSRAIRRAVAVVGLVGIALIHALDLDGKLTELPYIGVLFIVLIVASLAIAEGLMRSDGRGLWISAAVLAGLTLMGYAMSRTVGIPGDGGADVGNWLEPLGLASLVVEAFVVLVAIARLTDNRSPSGYDS